jgi:hypothetical protein
MHLAEKNLADLPANEEIMTEGYRGFVATSRDIQYARNEISASRWARGSAGRSAIFGPQKKKTLGTTDEITYLRSRH